MSNRCWAMLSPMIESNWARYMITSKYSVVQLTQERMNAHKCCICGRGASPSMCYLHGVLLLAHSWRFPALFISEGLIVFASVKTWKLFGCYDSLGLIVDNQKPNKGWIVKIKLSLDYQPSDYLCIKRSTHAVLHNAEANSETVYSKCLK